ncbi:hypothetical protein D9615_008207 [Tricholomella constricta]|uniref:Pectate lyase n=1 Tax=Tricholomella constricta TaxID=117010 RepID=A0A8H5H3I0_9AGAR|nr:hypothetical protein D9615_008207 [Tricholomella constricta]
MFNLAYVTLSLSLAGSVLAGVPAPAVTKAPTVVARALSTSLPASAGYSALPTARVITGSFDGKMVKYDRKGSGGVCQGQTETGEASAVFILESGASISNVIIGKDQAEGIHCRGPCKVTNVWWEDVCEGAYLELFGFDAPYRHVYRRYHYSNEKQIKQTGAGDVSTITGGGAFSASDKIVQHNGAGKVVIKDFFASTFGKLYRSCGNCSKSYARTVVVDNVCLKGGSEAVGINSNFGDTATLTNIKTNGKPSNANVCCTYKGVGSGSEPSKIGCGDSYAACKYTASAVGSC